ncbi:lysine acetyltransferase [Stagonosporopsis vannaccii]|nr:lysine acetyltransferase [Stagonosporopsis vannaccii]
MASIVSLPKGDSPTLALVHPTEEEQLIQSKLNGAEWRGALSPAAYLRRETTLSQQALTKDGGITYWILVDAALENNPLDPDSGTRLPLASCETYRKKALVWRDGKLQEVVSHGIGSVFCGQHLRKRGYAQRMMMELGKTLRTHQTDEQECLFTILYSDIGKKFYADFGWEPFPSSHIALPASSAMPPANLPTARPLYADDLPDLCKIDEELIRRSLESRTKGSKTAVALVPDVETVQWHHAREEFVSQEIHGKVPQVKGAIVGDEVGKRVWCYWTRVWYNEDVVMVKGNTMHILRLVVEDDVLGGQAGSMSERHTVAIAALLAFAQREAEEWKTEHVELWSPSATAVAAGQTLDKSTKVIDRDAESIASLLWYPEHEGAAADHLEWISNEKYAWC